MPSAFSKAALSVVLAKFDELIAALEAEKGADSGVSIVLTLVKTARAVFIVYVKDA